VKGRRSVLTRRCLVATVTLLIGLAANTMSVRTVASADTAASPASCTTGTWVQQSADVPPAMGSGTLTAVTVTSSTDAWAVGEYYNGSTAGSFWEHWDGSKWSVVGSGATNVELQAMTNFGADDVWAVGGPTAGVSRSAVIAHWNGSGITRSPLPTIGIGSELVGISGTSPSDIWAVGSYVDAHDAYHILLYHYDGATWRIAATPPHGPYGGSTTGLTGSGILALSKTDVWMTTVLRGRPTFLYRWNGSSWSDSVPASQLPHKVFGPLAGTSDSDLWAITVSTDDSVPIHWNGAAWTEFGPRGTHKGEFALDISEGPVGTVWAAGYYGNVPSSSGVLVQRNGVTSLSQPSPGNALNGVATSGGLVLAVGGTLVAYGEPQYPAGQPLVYMTCS
jgi:hypothetical protein